MARTKRLIAGAAGDTELKATEVLSRRAFAVRALIPEQHAQPSGLNCDAMIA